MEVRGRGTANTDSGQQKGRSTVQHVHACHRVGLLGTVSFFSDYFLSSNQFLFLAFFEKKKSVPVSGSSIPRVCFFCHLDTCGCLLRRRGAGVWDVGLVFHRFRENVHRLKCFRLCFPFSSHRGLAWGLMLSALDVLYWVL